MPSGRMSSGPMPDRICSTRAVPSWSNGAPTLRQPSTSPPGRLRPTWSRSALRSNRSGALVLGLLRRRRRRSLCCRSPMRPSPWRYAPGASVVPSPPRTLPRDSRGPKDRRRLSHGFSHVCAGSAGGALRLLVRVNPPKYREKTLIYARIGIFCACSLLGVGGADGVRRLTSRPADLYGIPDRGRIAPGAWADLLLFDPDTVGITPAERIADLPGGAAHDSPAHRRPWRVLQRRRGLRRRRLPHERPGAGAGAGPVRAVERGRSVGRVGRCASIRGSFFREAVSASWHIRRFTRRTRRERRPSSPSGSRPLPASAHPVDAETIDRDPRDPRAQPPLAGSRTS